MALICNREAQKGTPNPPTSGTTCTTSTLAAESSSSESPASEIAWLARSTASLVGAKIVALDRPYTVSDRPEIASRRRSCEKSPAPSTCRTRGAEQQRVGLANGCGRMGRIRVMGRTAAWGQITVCARGHGCGSASIVTLGRTSWTVGSISSGGVQLTVGGGGGGRRRTPSGGGAGGGDGGSGTGTASCGHMHRCQSSGRQCGFRV
eukprot:273342-Chlamydomonas_euryale.AAC.6